VVKRGVVVVVDGEEDVFIYIYIYRVGFLIEGNIIK
jgi:hypothetical protein